MKNTLLLMLLAAWMAGPGAAAQQPATRAPARDRVEAQRVAVLTNKLALTPEESARFWPIYNAHRAAMKDMREDWDRPDFATISDAEADRLLEEHIRQEYRKLELRKELVAQLRGVLPSRKILMIPAAEAEFNRELLRRVQDRMPPR